MGNQKVKSKLHGVIYRPDIKLLHWRSFSWLDYLVVSILVICILVVVHL